MKTNLLILALLVISSGMMAQRTIWEVDGDRNGAGFWGVEENWTNTLPGSEEDGRAIFKGGDVVVAGDVSPEGLGLPGDYRLELGDNKDANIAKLTVEDGGHVGALRISASVVGFWAPAILTVEAGGSVEIGEHLWVGSRKNYHEDTQGREGVGSDIHLNGGTITVHSTFGIDYFNDKEFSGGTLFMNGGDLILTDPDGWLAFDDPDSPDELMALGKNGKIEYTNGLIQLAGNHKESLEAYESIGRITGEFNIWTEIESIGEVEDSLGNMVADTTFITKLTNEDPPTSINSLPVENVYISPNPADNYLNVSLANDFIQSIEIIDLSGRVTDSFEYGNAKEATIELQGIAKGIYIVKVKGKESTDFEKVIIK